MLRSFLCIFMLQIIAGTAIAADLSPPLRIVGSSTVYPFTTTAAENFGKKGGFHTPVIESTGTGGGFKLFCSGTGADTPDINNASRTIKPSETALCAKNGVSAPLEIRIGYDGIVLANKLGAPFYRLTLKTLFLALAKQVPQHGHLVDNPYTRWHQIDSSLPDKPIMVYGFPPTSGTRDTFIELVMDKACGQIPEFASTYADETLRTGKCGLLREDGRFIEAGENGNFIVQKLIANPDALGFFGYSFLEENRDTMQASTIEGTLPEAAAIINGSYPIARPLYIYVKREHMNSPGMTEFLNEYTSREALGDEGYLAEKGLIPLPEPQRQQERQMLGLH